MRPLAPAAFVVALVLGGAAAAHPPDTFGLGSRSTAMAGAVSAEVTDFSANYYNPAGLALARGIELTIGYMSAMHRLEIDGNDSQIDPVRGLVAGLVAPGKIGELPVAFGLATHLSDDRLSRSRSVREEEPRFVFYDNRSQLIYLSANLSLRPVSWLSLGAGIGVLSGTRGKLRIRGTAVLPEPGGARSEDDSRLTHEIDADLTNERFAQLGVDLRVSERLSLSLVYRERAQVGLKMSADLRGELDAGVVRVPSLYALESETVSAYVPEQLVLGVSTCPRTGWRVNADLTWVRWSEYVSPVSRSRTQIEVEPTPGLPLEIPEAQPPTEPTPPRLSNRLVPRVGAEYAFGLGKRTELSLRGGYAFEKSPVPDQRGQTNFVDTDRHLVSAGSGLLWKRPSPLIGGDLSFDIHAQWSILVTRVTLKDSAADFVGDYRAGGDIFNIGGTFSVRFR